MSELVVVSWKWVGWRGEMYKAHHVNVLQHMVRKHLRVPHRFVCVTDDPRGVECETIPIWNDPVVQVQGKRPNCYRRLKIFSREAKKIFKADRLLSIDLDCVIFKDITPMVTGDDFRAMKGKASPLNGSMFLHTLDTKTSVWNTFGCNAQDLVRKKEMATKTRMYGSDQAWMSYSMPGAPVWDEKDGAYHYSLLKKDPPANTRVFFFAGSLKPWNSLLAQTAPRTYDTYARYSQEVYGLEPVDP